MEKYFLQKENMFFFLHFFILKKKIKNGKIFFAEGKHGKIYFCTFLLKKIKNGKIFFAEVKHGKINFCTFL